MTSLIAMEMAASKVSSPDFEQWLLSAERRCLRIRRQLERRNRRINLGIFALLWHWLDTWRDCRTGIAQYAMQQAAVHAGRENTASSVAKASIYAALWPPFLQSIQAGLQSGKLSNDISRLSAPSNRINLSHQFAERMGAMPEELARPIFSEDERELTQEQDTLVAWIRALHGDPMEIGRLLAQPSPNRAIRWFSEIEAIEADLSLAQVRKIFFVRNTGCTIK